MSFDIYLERFVPLLEGQDDTSALQALLDAIGTLNYHAIAARITECDGEVGVDVDVPLGNGRIRLSGAAFFLRSLGPAAVALVHRVAVAGDMVIIPVMEPPRFILVSESQRPFIPGDLDWGEPVVCATPDDLGALLAGGLDRWAAYRDQVAGPPGPCEPTGSQRP